MSTIAPPITDAQERVRRGAALLDAHGPPDWRELVDLDDFKFSDCNRCILGHVFGHYTNGLSALGLEDGYANGFNGGGSFATTYHRMEKAWREELCA